MSVFKKLIEKADESAITKPKARVEPKPRQKPAAEGPAGPAAEERREARVHVQKTEVLDLEKEQAEAKRDPFEDQTTGRYKTDGTEVTPEPQQEAEQESMSVDLGLGEESEAAEEEAPELSEEDMEELDEEEKKELGEAEEPSEAVEQEEPEEEASELEKKVNEITEVVRKLPEAFDVIRKPLEEVLKVAKTLAKQNKVIVGALEVMNEDVERIDDDVENIADVVQKGFGDDGELAPMAKEVAIQTAVNIVKDKMDVGETDIEVYVEEVRTLDVLKEALDTIVADFEEEKDTEIGEDPKVKEKVALAAKMLPEVENRIAEMEASEE